MGQQYVSKRSISNGNIFNCRKCPMVFNTRRTFYEHFRIKHTIMKKIISQKVSWNEKNNSCSLVTKFSDGSIQSEPITATEAAQFEAQHNF